MNNKKVSDKGLFIGLSIILVVFCCINIQRLYGPIIVPDETGYWATGYFLTGVSWDGIMGTSSYYGWGYGVVLAVICQFITSPVLAYRVAVLLNVVFLVLCFKVTVKISGYLFPENNSKFRIVSSFVVTAYSGYLYNTQTTYCETLILLLFWLLLLLIIKIVLDNKALYIVQLGVVSSCLVAVHLRMITCVFAVCVTIAYLLTQKKIRVKQMLLFVCVLGLGIISVFGVKEILENTLYARSSLMSTNTVSGQLSKASLLFSLNGISQLLKSVLGKIMYMGTATFLFAYSGIFLMIGFIYKKVIKRDEKIDLKAVSSIFIVVALAGAVALSAYSLITFGRLDHIIYGRYTEYLLGVILFFVFNSLNICLKRKYIVITIGMHNLICLFVFLYSESLNGLTRASAYTIPGLWGLTDGYSYDEILKLTLFAGIVSLVIYIVFVTLYKNTRKIVLLAGLSLVWFLVASNSAEYSLYNEQETREKDYLYFAEQIECIVREEAVNYVINDTEFVSWLKFKLKFFMPEIEMLAYETNEYDRIQSGEYIILYNEGKYEKEITMTRGELICSSKYFSLYRKA